MGREIRRVPVDFAWPRGKTWTGFINPHHRPCPDEDKTCFGGSTASGQWLDALCRFVDLMCSDALRGKAHPYMNEFAGAPRTKAGAPVPAGADFVALIEKIAKAKADNFMLQSQLGWPLQKRLLRLGGVKARAFGVCPTCKGNAQDPAVKAKYDAWKETPVPTGDGWQVWETVSEGSPISPVFATAEELAGHLSAVGDDWCNASGDAPPTFAQALAFVQEGFAMSAVIANGSVLGPYEQATALTKAKV